MNHLTTVNTGFPAPFYLGPGMYYTPEYIREQQIKFASDEYEREPKIRQHRNRYANPYRHTPRQTKICRGCHQSFSATRQQVVCSEACRKSYRLTYQAQYNRTQRKKAA